MDNDEARGIFAALRELMARHAGELVIVRDQPGDYHVDTAHTMKNGKPLFFGAVRIGKQYVSYHLMPVYVNPALLESLSPELRKRMQGKSCFNFARTHDSLLAELAQLTASGLDDYRRQGYV